jgi:hypothetical protein
VNIFEKIAAALKAHYDKLIAFVMLLCLIGSLLYLAVQIGRIQQMQKRWDEDLRRMKPTYPEAALQDEAVYQRAQKAISEPFQIAYGDWTNKQLVVPEERVWCPGCRWPIPYSTIKCPFCQIALKPVDQEGRDKDSDGDLMPDWWETKYGLNLNDAGDANKDKDGDGFTNIEEFDAKTDPSDAKSHPELIQKLRLERVEVRQFMLKFKGHVMGPDGFRTYQLNMRDVQHGGVKTFFVKIGQKVEGCTICSFEERYEMKALPGTKVAQRVDVSRLTLSYGDESIVLEKDVEAQTSQFTAHLFFSPDGKAVSGKEKDSFVIREERYKILRIDRDLRSVVIEREQDGKQFPVRKQ